MLTEQRSFDSSSYFQDRCFKRDLFCVWLWVKFLCCVFHLTTYAVPELSRSIFAGSISHVAPRFLLALLGQIFMIFIIRFQVMSASLITSLYSQLYFWIDFVALGTLSGTFSYLGDFISGDFLFLMTTKKGTRKFHCLTNHLRLISCSVEQYSLNTFVLILSY